MRKNIFLFISILLLILSTGCSNNSSIKENIGITKAKKEFIVEFNNWTGKETHNMYLHSGEIVNVTIENEGGELLYVKVSDDIYISDEIYKGKNPISTSFSFTPPHEKSYTFLVSGTNTKGKVSFIIEDSNIE